MNNKVLSKEINEAIKIIGEGTRRRYILQCAKHDIDQGNLNYIELQAVISLMKHSNKTYSEIISYVKGLDKE